MKIRHGDKFIAHSLLVFGSQTLVVLTGLVKALVVPVLLGVSDFAYWQLYVFYTVYVGLFTLGHNDGIYLKYGGYRFEDLPFAKLRASNAMHAVLLILGMALVALMAATASDPLRKIVFFAIAANIPVIGIAGNISLSLQAVNRIKDFAFLNAADKIFFSVALFALFYPEMRTFWFLILIDLVSKTSVLVALLFRYRQLYAGSFEGIAPALLEFRGNLRSGFQLMVANLSGMLVLGIGRIIIEYWGSLDGYSYYAFATSVAGIVLMSVTAMSVTIYPILKLQGKSSYSYFFEQANSAYLVFALGALISYFMAAAFIILVATSYAPVLEFLNVVFAITVLQGKMQLVNNTFYKALRLEGAMLWANLTSLLIASALSLLGYKLTGSVLSIAYATLLTMVLRVYASEIFLRRHMESPRSYRPLLEIALLTGFLALTSFASPIAGCFAWLSVVVLAMLIWRAQIMVTVRKLWQRA